METVLSSKYREVLVKYRLWVVGMTMILLSGCASMPTPATVGEEGIPIQLSYGRAFDKVIDLLESRGYTIALADKGTGIVETVPKRVPGENGAIHHNVLLSLLLRGGWAQTTVYLRVIVSSDYPDERKEITDSLKGLSP